jgi:glucose-6-phosphate isomerase
MTSEEVDNDEIRTPDGRAAAVDRAVADWQQNQNSARLWDGDESLWTGSGEARWLGWLGLPESGAGQSEMLSTVAPAALNGDVDDVVVLGMGGSSLCPDVLRTSFGRLQGAPALHVLDSTDPAQIRTLKDRVALDRTLFVVSSKSGTTLESTMLMEFFFEGVRSLMPAAEAGSRFVAVTDPGSDLEQLATERQFRSIFPGLQSVGGRFSALSNFGLVPAAAMGLDVKKLLARAGAMRRRCSADIPTRENPGVMLGLQLGVLARLGRDKLTLVPSPSVRGFGAWAEQLLAESTGKDGRGLIPVDGEDLGQPGDYGTDRVFVYLRDRREPRSTLDQDVALLEGDGHPVIRLDIDDLYDLGAEFFRWEFATAVTGALLNVNPFDQPDVEASKEATRRLTTAYEAAGTLPVEVPVLRDRDTGIALFAPDDSLASLGIQAGGEPTSLESVLGAHLSRLEPGDYFAVLAYVEMNDAHAASLQRLRMSVRAGTQNATCVGFGPRFLHSTGQMHKGGPNSGVFLQITCDDPDDIELPGRSWTFGAVKAAQARGDLAVLGERGRRVLRLHLAGTVREGLDRVTQAVGRALETRG